MKFIIYIENNESDSSFDENSSDMSNNLNEDNSNLKRLNIRAIELDWILNNTDGVKFLKTLSESDSIELFDLTIIRQIITFLWSHYRKAVFKYNLIPYLLYMALYLVYVTYFHKMKYEHSYSYMLGYGIMNDASVFILLIYILYFLYYEFGQIMFHKIHYFTSFWNMIDLISLLLNLSVLIIDFANVTENEYITFAGISVIPIWMKFFYWWRMFYSTSKVFRIMVNMLYDSKIFIGIYFLPLYQLKVEIFEY